MNLQGLPVAELLKLFAIFGGAMAVLYILKLRRRKVQVPFSPLWARVVEEKQSSSLFRALKRIGSLLVQWAIIALVILALGDPRLAGLGGCDTTPPEPPPPRHTLLMIDASASMATIEGGRTRLERARARAHEVVDQLATHPNQQVMVVQVDVLPRPLSLWSSDAALLHAAVDRVAGGPAGEALDTPTGVDDALRFAEDALRGRAGAEAILVSDLAFAPIPEERQRALALRVEPVVPEGAAGDNLGIGAFNVRPYLDDSLTYAVWYEIQNDTPREVKAQLFLYANPAGQSAADFTERGELVATLALTLPPGGRLTDVAPEVKFQGSRLFARLSPDSRDPTRDVFPRDDVAFAVVPPRRQMKVQLVSDGNLFINAALFLRENVTLTVTAPADYVGPDGFDVTVIDSADVDVSKPGNYFVVGPPAVNTRLGLASKGNLVEPRPDKIDQKHALARFVKLVDVNILEVPVFETERGDQVVVAAQGGAPLLFARHDKAADRKLVVLTFDLRKSLLPMSYAFPLLVVNALNWFYQDPEGLLVPNRAGVGLSLAWPFEGRELTVAPPPDVTAPIARRVGDRAQLTASRLGVYEIRAPRADGAVDVMPVAVNLLSPDESRVGPRADAKYAAWEAPPVVAVVEPSPWLAHLWRTLLLAAIAIVVLEWLTWHRRVTV
ncbi:MAG: VWA domain-containing protein [Deltaproteobacteria bacterium]|nr:VWA domain-containing protein [Deltaproteobacteria bacterium]